MMVVRWIVMDCRGGAKIRKVEGICSGNTVEIRV